MEKSSLIRFMGVPLRITWSALPVFLCIAYLKIELVIIYFISQILHEYAHVWAAQLCGWEAIEVKLTGFGANTTIYQPTKPSFIEIFPPLAGPMMNLVVVLLSYFLWPLYPNNTIIFIFIINFIMIFNLVPIYPSDGGRILHAFFALKYGRQRALEISKSINIVYILVLFGFLFPLVISRFL